jgi:nitroreductase
MDTFDCIVTKLDVREFITKNVSLDVRKEILEAARLTGTGLNTQHWRFIIVSKKDHLEKLAQDSTSGS